jgi:membrane-bound metal-dependent hydrolase YbcI (DUF457 family)
LLPDVTSGFHVGKRKVEPLKVLSKYSSFFHSFTFCVLISSILAFYIPIIAFGFFLGYGLHLLLDAWSPQGIRPFWPLKEVSSGKLKEGGVVEQTVFVVFCVLDVLFLIMLII